MKRYLSDCIELRRGKPIAKLNSGKIPAFYPNGIISYVENSLCNEKAIILPAIYSKSFKISFVNVPFYCSDSTYYGLLKDELNNEINLKYLYYVLSGMDFVNFVSEENIPRLSMDSYYSIEIDIPSIEEQNEIVQFFEDIEYQIDKNNKQIQKLKKQSEDMYIKWFEKFDIPKELYDSNDLKMVYNEKIGKNIPFLWDVERLETMISIEKGKFIYRDLLSEEYNKDFVRYINCRDYDSNDYIKFVNINNNLKLCDREDIMMETRCNIGKVHYGLFGAFGSDLLRIAIRGTNTQEYLRCYLSSNNVYEKLNKSNNKILNLEDLYNLFVIVPHYKVLEKFEKIQKEILDNIFCLMDNSELLIALKENIMMSL